MSNLIVTYKGSTIAELISSGTKILQTSSKYCESDILLNYSVTKIEDKIIDKTISGAYINDQVTTIGSEVFYGCTSLTTASFPTCKTIGGFAFQGCTSLTTASFSKCTTIGSAAFSTCTKLTTISFPVCTTIFWNAFRGCTSLTTASFPKCKTISSYVFPNCTRLTSLYLTNSSVATLGNSTAFSSTPIGGYSATAGKFGSIYVPSSLLASYKVATNWTYFSSRFVGI